MPTTLKEFSLARASRVGPHDTDTAITVVLRHATVPAPRVWPAKPAARASFGRTHGADASDLARVRRLMQAHGMTETACHPERRSLHLRASPASIEAAFGVRMSRYHTSDGVAFHACDGEPSHGDPAILAVLGLSNRPVAKPHFRRPAAQPAQTYTPLQLGALYDFPADTDGTGQGIGIIELGGGFSQPDLATYFADLKVKLPTVTAVAVDGGENSPGADADGEVMLDIEVAGALAPAATIAVYFAANTDAGFYNAIAQAAHDDNHKNTVISISWGGPEDTWSAQARAAMDSALQDAVAMGITVTVAAGDNGFTDGEDDNDPHVDYPAASPYALACGGTRLHASATAITTEVVWNELANGEGATGGGVSAVEVLPAWQAGAEVAKAANGFAGRGVPDVAGDADPATGYEVRVDGQNQVIGGTSAVAPLWAALIARLNQSLGSPLGDCHTAFYRIGEHGFRDITSGSNGKYKAATGWDACTGLGSPNGKALLAALKASA
jgi:kumamolisin